jgi:hypothetical protein
MASFGLQSHVVGRPVGSRQPRVYLSGNIWFPLTVSIQYWFKLPSKGGIIVYILTYSSSLYM